MFHVPHVAPIAIRILSPEPVSMHTSPRHDIGCHPIRGSEVRAYRLLRCFQGGTQPVIVLRSENREKLRASIPVYDIVDALGRGHGTKDHREEARLLFVLLEWALWRRLDAGGGREIF